MSPLREYAGDRDTPERGCVRSVTRAEAAGSRTTHVVTRGRLSVESALAANRASTAIPRPGRRRVSYRPDGERHLPHLIAGPDLLICRR